VQTSIVQAFVRWCERAQAPLRESGVSLECVASGDTPSVWARADLETPRAMWRVTVWAHNGMCDVEQLPLPSGELRYEHHENLDAAQLTRLMDALAVQVRTA
jgi:hypothetical protein